MATIFVDQPVKFRLQTFQDLTNAVTVKVAFKDPAGTTGELAGLVEGTKVSVNVAGGFLAIGGTWYFHSSVVFSGFTQPVIGKRASQFVHQLYERNYV